MQLQTPCPSKITCRPARRQTLNATNEFTFCALAAPFVPTVQVLCNWDQEKFGHTCETQMFSPPVPCLQPTPKPLSPAARRPACQAHIQRSREFDTSAAAACQIPLDMSPERRPKEVPLPALHTVTSVSPYRPTVPYRPFFSLVLHCTRDTLHRMARQP